MKPIIHGSLVATMGDAQRHARSTQNPWYVITIANGSGNRCYRHCGEPFLATDEYRDADGQVVWKVLPDGTCE